MGCRRSKFGVFNRGGGSTLVVCVWGRGGDRRGRRVFTEEGWWKGESSRIALLRWVLLELCTLQLCLGLPPSVTLTKHYNPINYRIEILFPYLLSQI